MTKTRMHSFWILQKGVNLHADRVLEERIATWGCVPTRRGGPVEDAEELSRYLLDLTNAKAYAAIHVNNRMMLESFHAFLTVKTLTEGFLPDWGFRQDSVAVVPLGELPELIGILGVLPPYAAWERLRKLCVEAQKQGRHILYRGLLREMPEPFEEPFDLDALRPVGR